MVAHVIVMIALAVQQFQADGHPVIFRNLLHAIQPRDRIALPLFIRHAATIPGKRNHVRHPRLSRQRNIRPKRLLNRRMVLDAVQSLSDLPAPRISHSANQPIPPRNLIFLRPQQINSPQPDRRRISRQLIDRNMRITPPTNRLPNPPLTRNRRRKRRRPHRHHSEKRRLQQHPPRNLLHNCFLRSKAGSESLSQEPIAKSQERRYCRPSFNTAWQLLDAVSTSLNAVSLRKSRSRGSSSSAEYAQ